MACDLQVGDASHADLGAVQVELGRLHVGREHDGDDRAHVELGQGRAERLALHRGRKAALHGVEDGETVGRKPKTLPPHGINRQPERRYLWPQLANVNVDDLLVGTAVIVIAIERSVDRFLGRDRPLQQHVDDCRLDSGQTPPGRNPTVVLQHAFKLAHALL